MTDIAFPEPQKNFNGGFFEIVSMASYLPPTQKSTAGLLADNGLTLKDTIIIRSTGVAQRHIADTADADSDVLAKAARACLSMADTSVNDLSRIFVNKLLGDRILPPTSAMMQRKLNALTAVQCMDIDGGANAFLQSLLMACRCLDAGDDTILIASGGVHQRLMNAQDSRTGYLFGDAGTALLLRRSDTKHLLAQYEFSNHSLGHLHHAVDFYHFIDSYLRGGALNLFEMENIREADAYYQQAAKHTMNTLLDSAKCVKDDIDMFFVTQMNLPLWQSIVMHLNLPGDKLISVLPHTGNTFSANIPLQLIEWQNEMQHRSPSQGLTALSGKKIMIISLGEGFLGGGCIYQF